MRDVSRMRSMNAVYAALQRSPLQGQALPCDAWRCVAGRCNPMRCYAIQGMAFILRMRDAASHRSAERGSAVRDAAGLS